MVTLGLVTGRKTRRWTLEILGIRGFATVADGFVACFGVLVFLTSCVRPSTGLPSRWVVDELHEGSMRAHVVHSPKQES